MVQRQVITIGPQGQISGLQRKPGQGVDLRTFGKADIERASLIEWDADAQAWYINVLQDAGKGVVTLRDVITANCGIPPLIHFTPSVVAPKSWNDTIMFGEYDDAVKVEIAYLDALRLRGQF